MTAVIGEKGNPANVTLATKMVESHCALFGKPPRQVSVDGGFALRKNLAEIEALGVKDVDSSKPCGMRITELVKSTSIFRQLWHFRAGIEAGISFLNAPSRVRWRLGAHLQPSALPRPDRRIPPRSSLASIVRTPIPRLGSGSLALFFAAI